MKTLIGLLIFSNFAFSHSEFAGNIKGTSNPCSLRVEQVYFVDNLERPENLRADVVASLHDDDHHIARGEEFFFTIKLGSRPNIFSGLGSNQKDQINVLTKAGSTALNIVESYAVRWLHISHYHSAQCVNLKRVKE